jgi:hypothetical protein
MHASITQYFSAEKQESVLFVVAGSIAVVASAVLWQKSGCYSTRSGLRFGAPSSPAWPAT